MTKMKNTEVLQTRLFRFNMWLVVYILIVIVPLGYWYMDKLENWNIEGISQRNRSIYGLHSIIPRPKVNVISCAKLFSGDREQLLKAQARGQRRPKAATNIASIINGTASSCEQFRTQRRYILGSLSEEEEGFPLAFAIVLYKDVDQAERLLRAVYRPQNYYCIHVDAKSSPVIHNAVKAIASCFPNVFVASRSINVKWASYSVVEAHLVCMQDLLNYKGWKYFINLTGQEFPLKTNRELVEILKVFNGSNDILGSSFYTSNQPSSVRHRLDYYVNPTKGKKDKSKTLLPFMPPLNMVKGSLHITVSRGYVDYAINDPLAVKFQDWCKMTSVPDETFFATLHHNPQLGVPGAYRGGYLPHKSINRFKKWKTSYNSTSCQGMYSHGICIIGVGDLQNLRSTQELFVNKLHADFQPLAYDCLEEWYFNRIRDEVDGTRTFDATPYKKLDFVYAYNTAHS